ncbi:hypothetical protein [Mammaliicoccus vitulinus]|nr:hypothetical protein [Mammaliicoccus vitulinus]
MLGVTAAGSTLLVASVQASKTALKQIPKQALTKMKTFIDKQQK